MPKSLELELPLFPQILIFSLLLPRCCGNLPDGAAAEGCLEMLAGRDICLSSACARSSSTSSSLSSCVEELEGGPLRECRVAVLKWKEAVTDEADEDEEGGARCRVANGVHGYLLPASAPCMRIKCLVNVAVCSEVVE